MSVNGALPAAIFIALLDDRGAAQNINIRNSAVIFT